MESAPCPKPKIPSLTSSVASKGDLKISPVKDEITNIQIPKYGIFENINSTEELAQMSQWTEEKPLQGREVVVGSRSGVVVLDDGTRVGL
ncbi:ATP phosphoribosyltransferase, catalytic domain-containing protein [Sesbania bispinosa]|nr:ATP phosphoribosyltransferase, catalytic domain-containing protein [Sesbania bispinosa]